MGIDEKLIQEIVRRILTVAQPDKIILFGSAATGQMTKDSDIDLLVLEAEAKDTHEEIVRLRRVIGDLGYPFDVLVMQTERFEETKEVIGGIAYPARKYGKVVYAGNGRLAEAPVKPRECVVRELAEGWLEQAQHQLKVARHLAQDERAFPNHVAMYSHSSAESLLRAFLVRQQVEIPKTHLLSQLLGLVSAVDGNLAEALQESTALDPFRIDMQEPGLITEATPRDAKQAIELAARVRTAILASLED